MAEGVALVVSAAVLAAGTKPLGDAPPTTESLPDAMGESILARAAADVAVGTAMLHALARHSHRASAAESPEPEAAAAEGTSAAASASASASGALLAYTTTLQAELGERAGAALAPAAAAELEAPSTAAAATAQPLSAAALQFAAASYSGVAAALGVHP